MAAKEGESVPSEAAPSQVSVNDTRRLFPDQDAHLVTWAMDDRENPKNWSMSKKWAVTITVSLFTFISPVSSSMISPALTKIAKELNITSEVESELSLSVFVLAYAVGPLCFGPLSELFGRAYVLQCSNLCYVAWNLGCGFAQTSGQLIAFRFMSGIAGSAPLAIGGGVLSDCWNADQRGKAVGIYSLAPLLGPVVGPIAGGFITETTTWRWVFWATSIAGAVIQLIGLAFLPETYAPTLLKRRARTLRQKTGDEAYHTEADTQNTSLMSTLQRALVRPFILLTTQPIVQVIALYMAYLFGLFYLLLSTFPQVWENVYGESVGIGGLNYISLGIGFVLGAQVNARASDRIYKQLKAKRNNTGLPEFRIPAMFVGSLFIPVGLFWYGWSVQAHIHWIMPNIGIVLFSIGSIVCLQCMQTYVIDSYTRFAASGLAAAVVLRSLAGFSFPLFAPYMYNKLQYGWGNSLLGFLSIGIGVPAPWVFWFWGAKLRGMSRYASG
ncbi:MFS transporter [Aspergillus vadensis CBS 113365]|uniref:MFS transporter n=1 Tax=Aspergillus vadensis (strain CBS 113365 / IMI 142717 / IBT 24658) TaxID=1448311 RepID=A0A319BRR4_ASPVC|nr:MFS transporter [Aspergillus vadensis CBS 113365]PYH75204.1 MFS transporter [Aspergillus vadensis CBS 113365]